MFKLMNILQAAQKKLWVLFEYYVHAAVVVNVIDCISVHLPTGWSAQQCHRVLALAIPAPCPIPFIIDDGPSAGFTSKP